MQRYEKGIREVWDENPKKRKQLLKAMGMHESFSEVKYDDLHKRSGGHVRSGLDELFGIWKTKNPRTTIR
jgi:hypothetical protein